MEFCMTPREMTRNETVAKPFTSQELILHGRPNWAACVFFSSIALLHLYIAIHLLQAAAAGGMFWEGLISSLLGGCFLLVALTCALLRSDILICPRLRVIRLRSGIGRLSTERRLPFAAVRAVRVTLWETRGRSRSRLAILCNGDEIPCPATTIPRQQALYLALVMNVRLIKISDDRSAAGLVHERSDSTRW
jgi:hypothetical protein